MERTIFKNFEKRHCRFKMKSGKEVYGVMWEEPENENKYIYYFSSSRDYQRFKTRLQTALYAVYKLDLSEVIHAELLAA